MKKKLLCVLLVLICAFGAFGCGGNTAGEDKPIVSYEYKTAYVLGKISGGNMNNDYWDEYNGIGKVEFYGNYSFIKIYDVFENLLIATNTSNVKLR